MSALLVAASLAGAVGTIGCGDRQSRDSNPEATDEERTDQRRPPPDASGDPAAPATPVETSTTE